jgi:hypothetical protein
MPKQLVDTSGRFLNHAELIYRPGERALSGKVFETLGCRVMDNGGTWVIIAVNPASDDWGNNVLYASEVTPEQWRFEQTLQKQLAGESPLGGAFAAFDQHMRKTPQRTTHFGIRFPTVKMLDETLARIQSGLGPDLRGRLSVSGVFRPGDPGSLSPTLIQAFVRTDVVAAGFVTLGQHIELQAVPGT